MTAERLSADEAALLREVGNRAARLRTDLGMTQAAAARAAGMPVTALGVIERGERPASVLRLAALARVLRVPLGELLRDLPGEPPPPPAH